MKDLYFKKDIEAFLKNNSNFETKIYETYDDMIRVEKRIKTDCKNIYEYTDGLFNFNNSKCYFIAGEIYPNSQYGSNVMFIQYDKNDIPYAIFVENNFCVVSDTILQMVEKSKNYLLNNSQNNV